MAQKKLPNVNRGFKKSANNRLFKDADLMDYFQITPPTDDNMVSAKTELSYNDQVRALQNEINQKQYLLSLADKTKEDVEEANDDRNIIQKFLNLDKNAGVVSGFFDLINRPSEAVKGFVDGFDASGKYNPLLAGWQGLTGKKRFTINDIFKNKFGIDISNWNPLVKVPMSFAYEIALDPLSYWQLPVDVLFKGLKNFSKAVLRSTADLIGKTPNGAQFLKTFKNVTDDIGLSFRRTFGLYKDKNASKFLDDITNYRRSVNIYQEESMTAINKLVDLNNELGKRLRKEYIIALEENNSKVLDNFHDIFKQLGYKDFGAIEALGNDDWINFAHKYVSSYIEHGGEKLAITDPEVIEAFRKQTGSGSGLKLIDNQLYFAEKEHRAFFDNIYDKIQHIVNNGGYSVKHTDFKNIGADQQFGDIILFIKRLTGWKDKDILKEIKISPYDILDKDGNRKVLKDIFYTLKENPLTEKQLKQLKENMSLKFSNNDAILQYDLTPIREYNYSKPVYNKTETTLNNFFRNKKDKTIIFNNSLSIQEVQHYGAKLKNADLGTIRLLKINVLNQKEQKEVYIYLVNATSEKNYKDIYNNISDAFKKDVSQFKKDLPSNVKPYIMNAAHFADARGFHLGLFESTLIKDKIFKKFFDNEPLEFFNKEMKVQWDKYYDRYNEITSNKYSAIQDINDLMKNKNYYEHGGYVWFSKKLRDILEKGSAIMDDINKMNILTGNDNIFKLLMLLKDKKVGTIHLPNAVNTFKQLEQLESLFYKLTDYKNVVNKLADIDDAGYRLAKMEKNYSIQKELNSMKQYRGKLFNVSATSSDNLFVNVDVDYNNWRNLQHAINTNRGITDKKFYDGNNDFFSYIIEQTQLALKTGSEIETPTLALSLTPKGTSKIYEDFSEAFKSVCEYLNLKTDDAYLRAFFNLPKNILKRYPFLGRVYKDIEKMKALPEKVLPLFKQIINVNASLETSFERLLMTMDLNIPSWNLNKGNYLRALVNPDILTVKHMERLIASGDVNVADSWLRNSLGANYKKFYNVKSFTDTQLDINKFYGKEYFQNDFIKAAAISMEYNANAFKVGNIFRTSQENELIKQLDVNELLENGIIKNKKELDTFIKETYSSEYRAIDQKELNNLRSQLSMFKEFKEINYESNIWDDFLNKIDEALGQNKVILIHDATGEALKELVKNTNSLFDNPNSLLGFLNRYVVVPFKRFATFTLGFHFRNYMSNTINAYLAGIPLTEYGVYMNKAQTRYKEFERVANKVNNNLSKSEWKVNNLSDFKKALSHILNAHEKNTFVEYLDLYAKGVLNNTRLNDDHFELLRKIKDSAMGKTYKQIDKTVLTKKLKDISNMSFAYSRKMDDLSKLSAYMWATHSSKANKILKRLNIETPEAFSKFVFFDYERLTPTERGIMKRIFPFYTWVRKNVEFQLRNFMSNSKKYIRLLNVWDGWKNSFISDPDQETDYLKNAMYLPIWKTDKELTYIKFSLPFLELDDLFTGKMLLSNLTPIIKEPLQYILGYNLFSGKRLDTNGVNIPLVGDISKFPQYTWDILTGKELTSREKASLGIVGQRWTNTLKSIVNLSTFGTADFNIFKQFPTIFTTSNYQDVYISNLRNELNMINNYIYNARNFGIFIPNSMSSLYSNYVGVLRKWNSNNLGYKKRRYW